MAKGLFVTGTDTGVGKTLVTAGILRCLRKRGTDAVPMKPVQTGGELKGNRLFAPDLEFCLAAAGIEPGSDERQLMLPYVYGPACSPHLAARMAQHYPKISRIKDCADRLLQSHQVVVVEGAGGVMVPLNESATTLDLMQALGYPVVLVSRLGLGTINHTMLSLHALRTAGIKLVGVVFNRTEAPRPENRFIEEDNPKAVTQFSGAMVLGNIRYFGDLDTGNSQDRWAHFEADMTGLDIILNELEV